MSDGGGAEHGRRTSQRYEYEMIDWGDEFMVAGWGNVVEPKHETLEDAIHDMAADGWRFVQAFNRTAVFERPVIE